MFTEKVKTTFNEECGFIKCELNKYSYNLLVNAFTCNVNEFLFLKNNDVHLTTHSPSGKTKSEYFSLF